jgi:hypothetical protein
MGKSKGAYFAHSFKNWSKSKPDILPEDSSPLTHLPNSLLQNVQAYNKDDIAR